MSKLFNYEADQIHDMVHPDLLTDTSHYVAECKDIILNEVTPNYPKLTEYEKEWMYFAENVYQAGHPVNLEYQTVDVDGYASVENAIPFCYKEASLKGNTLVNLVKTVDNNGLINAKYTWIVALDKDVIKPSTTYTWFIYNDSSADVTLYQQGWFTYTTFTIPANSFYKLASVTKDSANAPSNAKPDCLSVLEDMTVEQKLRVMLIEGDYTNVDIPYFEGMKSVQMPVLKTAGKNLFDVNSLTNVSNRIKNYSIQGHTLSGIPTYQYEGFGTLYIRAKKGESYTVSCHVNANTSTRIEIRQYNDMFDTTNAASLYTTTTNKQRTITALGNVIKITISNGNQIEYTEISNIQVEQNTTQTSYEPYQSNSLTVNEVELRGVGEVKDELNLLTGELTQRIGEVVLNGSEDWKTLEPGRYYLQNILNNVNRADSHDINFECDKLKPISYENEYIGMLGIVLFENASYDFIVRTDIQTREAFKQWLSNHPTTVQYPLATESIKTVDLNTIIKPYEGTNHYYTSSDTIPPSCTLHIPVESTGTKTLNEISQED